MISKLSNDIPRDSSQKFPYEKPGHLSGDLDDL